MPEFDSYKHNIKLERCGCGGEAEMYHWPSEDGVGDYSAGCSVCDMTTGWVQGSPEKAAGIWNVGVSGAKK